MREGRGLPSWRGAEGWPESASPGARNVPEPSLTLGVGDVFVLFDNVKGKEIVFILCVSFITSDTEHLLLFTFGVFLL